MIKEARLSAVVMVASLFGSSATLTQPTPAPGEPVDSALIEDLVAANRFLAREGLFDAYGHISIRHPHNRDRYLMSRSLAPALVTAEDILEYDLDSNPIDPDAPRSVLERFIHGEIYKRRPDVNTVIHSHSPTVIPFSAAQVPLRPIMHMAYFLWVGVPVWEIRDAGGPATNLLVSNPDLGQSLAETLGDKPVALMRGHGNVVVAEDIPTTVRYAYYTEINARQQAIAIGLGGPITYISDEEGAAWDANPGDFARAWNLWKSYAQ